MAVKKGTSHADNHFQHPRNDMRKIQAPGNLHAFNDGLQHPRCGKSHSTASLGHINFGLSCVIIKQGGAHLTKAFLSDEPGKRKFGSSPLKFHRLEYPIVCRGFLMRVVCQARVLFLVGQTDSQERKEGKRKEERKRKERKERNKEREGGRQEREKERKRRERKGREGGRQERKKKKKKKRKGEEDRKERKEGKKERKKERKEGTKKGTKKGREEDRNEKGRRKKERKEQRKEQRKGGRKTGMRKEEKEKKEKEGKGRRKTGKKERKKERDKGRKTGKKEKRKKEKREKGDRKERKKKRGRKRRNKEGKEGRKTGKKKKEKFATGLNCCFLYIKVLNLRCSQNLERSQKGTSGRRSRLKCEPLARPLNFDPVTRWVVAPVVRVGGKQNKNGDQFTFPQAVRAINKSPFDQGRGLGWAEGGKRHLGPVLFAGRLFPSEI
ncbi:RNA-binding protein 25, partial [Ophiophagus hannah]